MRRWTRAMFGAGCAVVVQVAGTTRASAAEPAKLEGFDVLGNVGYGIALDSYVDYALIEDTDADPLGFLVGLDFGYTWRFGLRLGATATHGFGREFEETR